MLPDYRAQNAITKLSAALQKGPFAPLKSPSRLEGPLAWQILYRYPALEQALSEAEDHLAYLLFRLHDTRHDDGLSTFNESLEVRGFPFDRELAWMRRIREAVENALQAMDQSRAKRILGAIAVDFPDAT